jgi:hypothetical protein
MEEAVGEDEEEEDGESDSESFSIFALVKTSTQSVQGAVLIVIPRLDIVRTQKWSRGLVRD